MDRKSLHQRHDMNIPSSEMDEEFIIVVLAVGVCKDIPTLTCCTASPHTMKDATGVPPERPVIYDNRA